MMRRILLVLAVVFSSVSAFASVPPRVPTIVPSIIPGGGGLPPIRWVTPPTDQSVNEGVELAFSVVAKSGGQTATYAIGANDSGAVNASTGEYTWTPSYVAGNRTNKLTTNADFELGDFTEWYGNPTYNTADGDSAIVDTGYGGSKGLRISVTGATGIYNMTTPSTSGIPVTEGKTYIIKWKSNGDRLTYNYIMRSGGNANIVASTTYAPLDGYWEQATATWTAPTSGTVKLMLGYQNAGADGKTVVVDDVSIEEVGEVATYTVTFTATAGGRTLSKAVTITVNNVAIAWVHEPHDTSGVEGYALTHTFNATSDCTIVYSATGLPYNATYDAGTGAFAWTPVGLQADTSWTPTFTAAVNGDTIHTQIDLTCGIVANYTTGLLAWWKMDNSGVDSSGNAYNGTISGAVAANDRFARANKALEFDGADDRVAVAHAAALNIGSGATVAVWLLVQTTGELTGGRVIDKSDDIFVSNGWMVRTGDTAAPIDTVWTRIAAGTNSSIGVGAYGGEWHHFAWRIASNGTVTYFFDGDSAGVSTTSATSSITTTESLYIGSNKSNDRAYDGLMDDLRIYTGQLSATEVKQIMYWRD